MFMELGTKNNRFLPHQCVIDFNINSISCFLWVFMLEFTCRNVLEEWAGFLLIHFALWEF